MSLYLHVLSSRHRDIVREHVQNRRPTDSGVDLPSQGITLLHSRPVAQDGSYLRNNLGIKMELGVVAAALDADGKPAPCLLLARSSMSLTPLRLANQIGLVDAGYRGQLIARVDCLDPTVEDYSVAEGHRLFQIVQHNWLPFKNVYVVESATDLPAPPDNRGSGGFGSTGN